MMLDAAKLDAATKEREKVRAIIRCPFCPLLVLTLIWVRLVHTFPAHAFWSVQAEAATTGAWRTVESALFSLLYCSHECESVGGGFPVASA